MSDVKVVLPSGASVTLPNPLPVQDGAAEASLANIDTSTAATTVSVAALNTKLGAGMFTLPYDEVVLTYVGATTQLDTAVSKLATVTQQTLTFSYDGSNRLIDVLRS